MKYILTAIFTITLISFVSFASEVGEVTSDASSPEEISLNYKDKYEPLVPTSLMSDETKWLLNALNFERTTNKSPGILFLFSN